MTGSPPARGGSWKDDQGHKWATVLFFGVDVSGKTAEPKMAFNFAHLLSAACGGAPLGAPAAPLGALRAPVLGGLPAPKKCRVFCNSMELGERLASPAASASISACRMSLGNTPQIDWSDARAVADAFFRFGAGELTPVAACGEALAAGEAEDEAEGWRPRATRWSSTSRWPCPARCFAGREPEHGVGRRRGAGGRHQVHDIFVAACCINLSVLGQLVREPVRGDGRRLRHNDGEQDAFHGEIEK